MSAYEFVAEVFAKDLKQQIDDATIKAVAAKVAQALPPLEYGARRKKC